MIPNTIHITIGTLPEVTGRTKRCKDWGSFTLFDSLPFVGVILTQAKEKVHLPTPRVPV